ncbi:MAG: hypothetical protein J6A89_07035 [Clostridia bacterium]|nr:hypothetical protein [Clostridia bacterium]
MLTDTINMIIKSIFLNIFSIMIFFRINNYRKVNKMKNVVILIVTICLSCVYIFFKESFDIVMATFVTYLLQIILLKVITKQKISSIVISFIISISLSCILFIFSVTLEFFIQKLFNIKHKIINVGLTLIIEFIMIYFILKMKRLKNGLAFLQKINEYIIIALIDISAFVIVLYGLIGTSYDNVIKHRFLYFIILGICMIITVQKILVMYYKQKLIDDTINQYKEELQQKNNEIKKLTDEAFKISKINHEFYNRQKSLELMVKNKLQNSNIEAGEDFNILNRIKELTSEHSEKVKEIKSLPALPLTDISEIDDMFKYMQKECDKSGIQFKLKVNGNIHFLINNIIQKSKLETLIGDHIKDAIIAINSSNNINKEILVIMGIKDNCYELCIYDTGIEFEIETLFKLGLVPTTTHKDTGGSGIGFMTTFETLKECKASLIIEEKHPMNDKDYTKAVIIRFDDKNEYKISSYRAEEIRCKTKDNRIIVL